MNEIPILMGRNMVLAILNGRKTQTRRPVKPQPRRKPVPCPYKRSGWGMEGLPNEFGVKGCSCEEVCNPYGQPGDRLWVRETWAVAAGLDSTPPRNFRAWPVKFKADNKVVRFGFGNAEFGKWRPSIHMPRWASRIILEITDVRVERLQDITDDDAVADIGCRRTCNEDEPCDTSVTSTDPVGDFRALWDSIYYAGIYKQPTPFKWDANPWVWVVEFRRITA